MHLPAVGQGRNGDERIVPDFVAARHEHRAIGDVAVGILKFIRRQADAERKFFLHHQHPAFEPRLEHEQHRRRHGGFVGELQPTRTVRFRGVQFIVW